MGVRRRRRCIPPGAGDGQCCHPGVRREEVRGLPALSTILPVHSRQARATCRAPHSLGAGCATARRCIDAAGAHCDRMHRRPRPGSSPRERPAEACPLSRVTRKQGDPCSSRPVSLCSRRADSRDGGYGDVSRETPREGVRLYGAVRTQLSPHVTRSRACSCAAATVNHGSSLRPAGTISRALPPSVDEPQNAAGELDPPVWQVPAECGRRGRVPRFLGVRRVSGARSRSRRACRSLRPRRQLRARSDPRRARSDPGRAGVDPAPFRSDPHRDGSDPYRTEVDSAPSPLGPTPFPPGPAPCRGGPSPCRGGPSPCRAGPTPCRARPTPCRAGPTLRPDGPTPCRAGATLRPYGPTRC
jgi:hypothetical protein